MDNRAVLERLFASGGIALRISSLFEAAPAPLHTPRLWDRIEGMLLGLAIGDSLGNTTEGLLPDPRGEKYGTIRDYLPNPHAGNRPVGLPSQDTQLAIWTLEQLLADKGLVPDHLARRFCQQWIFRVSRTLREFIRRYKDEQVPWERAGVASAGNGALARIAPILVPHLRQPSPAVWADVALAAMVTHNDPASIGSCLALERLLWEVMGLSSAPDPRWWVDLFCSTLRPLEGAAAYETRSPHVPYRGPLWLFVEASVPRAVSDGLSVRDACDWWHSGSYLMETVPTALFILARHAHDPEEALVRAVNDTKDNNTIAAIVGAVVGALHGRSGLPGRWIKGLLGRIGAADDGQLFEFALKATGGTVCRADDLRPDDILVPADEVRPGDTVFFVRQAEHEVQLRVLGEAHRKAFTGIRYRVVQGDEPGSVLFTLV